MPQIVDYIVIGVYLALLLVVGQVFSRLNHNISDYFRSGCRGTWWLVGTSLFVSGVSAVTFTANAGLAFNHGWTILAVYFSGSAAGFIHIFLAPRFRRIRCITGPEMMRLRFGPVTQQFYAYLGFLQTLPGAGIVLWGLSLFCSTVFGLPLKPLIVVLGLVIVFYSATGGKWAVMATDFVQGLVMVTVAVVVAVLCLNALGGVSGMFEKVRAAGLSEQFRILEGGDSSYNLVWAVSIFLISMVYAVQLGAAGRYFSVKDDREARRTAFLAWLLASVFMLIWFIPPIAARLLYADQTLAVDLPNPADSAYAVAAMRVLPKGMPGLLLIAMFSATMSTLDSALNANAAMFARDAYPAACKLIHRTPASGHRLLALSRWFTVGFGVIIIALALFFAEQGGKGMFDLMMSITAMLGLPMLTPLIFALFIPKAPTWAAMASVISAYAVSVPLLKIGMLEPLCLKVFTNLGVGGAVFLFSTLFWNREREEYQQRVLEFYQRMRTPVDFEKEVGAANDRSQLQLVGRFVLGSGLLIALLLLVPNKSGGRLAIGAVAGVVTFVGLLMEVTGWRMRKKEKKKR